MGTLSGCAEAVHGVMVRTDCAGPEWVCHQAAHRYFVQWKGCEVLSVGCRLFLRYSYDGVGLEPARKSGFIHFACCQSQHGGHGFGF
jgi:hypothetical protein